MSTFCYFTCFFFPLFFLDRFRATCIPRRHLEIGIPGNLETDSNKSPLWKLRQNAPKRVGGGWGGGEIIIKCISFVSRCGHLSFRSWPFDCLQPVLIRRWGRLVARHHMYRDGLLYLARFNPCCSGEKLFPERSDLKLFPPAVRRRTSLLSCFLIVGIHASGLSIPLSLLMLLGWSLIWIASLSL